MKLTLIRNLFRKDGVFGEIQDVHGNTIFVTLEHAYQVAGTDLYRPKLSAGTYTCRRRQSKRFKCEVFEIKDVPHDEQFLKYFGIEQAPDHTAILFHVGNYNEESDGCVLLGEALGFRSDQSYMLKKSGEAFNRFMAILKGHDTFVLVVEDYP